MTSFDAFVSYLALEKKYSTHTVNAYQKDIKEFTNFCIVEYEVSIIDDVSYSMIRSWVVFLVNNSISNRTINRKLSLIHI